MTCNIYVRQNRLNHRVQLLKFFYTTMSSRQKKKMQTSVLPRLWTLHLFKENLDLKQEFLRYLSAYAYKIFIQRQSKIPLREISLEI